MPRLRASGTQVEATSKASALRSSGPRGTDLGFEGTDGAVTVQGDVSRLREMLDNLVDNAVRYGRQGGHVTVKVGAAPARIDVIDDGPAIPPAERERIFERFHRMLGNEVGGSGLGLAIAREIARIHGATLELHDTADGAGNSFRVVFGATRPPERG